MANKTCKECGKIKKETEFYNSKSKSHRITTKCKSCLRFLDKERRKSCQKTRKRRTKLRISNFQFVRELKEKTPCTDCKRIYPFFVMEYDHLPGYEKITTVSRLANSLVSKEKILAEISKCELVCAICHRIRTWNRRYPNEQVKLDPKL